jgi:mannose-6-phosphate isomerase-like protein (cupin superfamily)
MTHQAFALGGVLAERARLGERFREFLRVPALSAGVYVLPVGGSDPQSPHAEDELYFVVRGRAMLHVGGVDVPVAPESVVYVPARVAHRFHTITEELSVLVCFAPAETSGGGRC